VAFGAAVQGGIICGDTSEETESLVIIDATPLTLGIETVGGVMSKIIPKGSFIPTKKQQTFTTYQDNQTTVTISVYEGERPMVKDNHMLGKFDLSGIAPAPRGVPQIEVAFEIDANGILQVGATDKGSNKTEKIVITNDKGRLSKEEIEQMLRDAEEFAEQDKMLKEKIDAKNSLENYVYSMKNTVEDPEKLADKLEDEEKSTIKDAIQEAQGWLDSNAEASKEEYEEKLKELEGVCNPIISKVYKEQGGQGE